MRRFLLLGTLLLAVTGCATNVGAPLARTHAADAMGARSIAQIASLAGTEQDAWSARRPRLLPPFGRRCAELAEAAQKPPSRLLRTLRTFAIFPPAAGFFASGCNTVRIARMRHCSQETLT